MRLYNATTSGNCYKVRLLLAQLGREAELVEIDVVDRSGRPDDVLRASPGGRVPVLVLDDGRGIAESGAILWYLAEGTPFLPADRYGRAEVLKWMFFEQYEHEPNIAVARFWTTLLGRPEEHAAELDAKHAGGYRALAAMERHLGSADFFVAGRYTIADVALYAYTHVAGEGGFDLEPYPNVHAWLERVREQPGHVPMA